MFTESGYTGTSLRAIAAEAGIAESQIVRNFESKADLFTQAVAETIRDYVTNYYTDWAANVDDYTVEQTIRNFLAGLYDLFWAHQKLLRALIVSHETEPADRSELNFGALLKQVEEVEAFEIERGGYRVSPTTIRSVVGMVLSMTVLQDFMYPSSEVAPNRDQLIDELTAITVHGIFRPDGR
jgi:AcrR family transcriptional regulator